MISDPSMQLSPLDQDLISWASMGNANGVRVALSRGANANACMQDGVTALLAAADHGDAGVCIMLYLAGADVNARSKVGHTMLSLGIAWRDIDMIIACVAAGGDVSTMAYDTEKPTKQMLGFLALSRLEAAIQTRSVELVVHVLESLEAEKSADLQSKLKTAAKKAGKLGLGDVQAAILGWSAQRAARHAVEELSMALQHAASEDKTPTIKATTQSLNR